MASPLEEVFQKWRRRGLPPAQDSTTDQVIRVNAEAALHGVESSADLARLATVMGCYDAADYFRLRTGHEN